GMERIRMGILFPTEEMMPNSSLAHYLALAVREFGAAGSQYFVGPEGMDVDALSRSLQQAESDGTPYALLGASYSFVHLMDALNERGLTFSLPSGSRLFDTGGFKGQAREMSTAEVYAQLTACFGVAADDCTNLYGRTEVRTRFYANGNAIQPSLNSGPPWIRTRAVGPVARQDVPKGARGVLVHCDLADCRSPTTRLTEDVGVMVADGF